MKSFECTNCGASLKKNTLQCAYCGSWYENDGRVISGRERPNETRSNLNLPVGVGEFGIANNKLFVAGVVITFILYLLGWFFEDTHYWLNSTAMTIWVGIIPLWLFGVALFWNVNRRVMFVFLPFSLVVFVVHMAVIWAIRGNLWDDHVGIAAMVSGASLFGWVLGRLLHGIIRLRKVSIP